LIVDRLSAFVSGTTAANAGSATATTIPTPQRTRTIDWKTLRAWSCSPRAVDMIMSFAAAVTNPTSLKAR
jgi:hypothetical protein